MYRDGMILGRIRRKWEEVIEKVRSVGLRL